MKRYRGISDAQANAEALERRSAPYSQASGHSFTVRWDWHRREPRDLRDAVRMVRTAHADEIPERLHEQAIGEDGTPRMTTKAEGYIFGSAGGSDVRRNAETGKPDEFLSYYHAPFKATLERFLHGDERSRRLGRIVSHITVGQQPPVAAALAEKAHPLDAKLVAEDALRVFLRNLSDLKLHIEREHLSEEVEVA